MVYADAVVATIPVTLSDHDGDSIQDFSDRAILEVSSATNPYDVTINDQISCESIPNAVWSTFPNTCTIITDQTIASGEIWTVDPLVELVINSDTVVEIGGTINSGDITINAYTVIINGPINATGDITINAFGEIFINASLFATGNITLSASIDQMPPTIGPVSNITQDATKPDGATINYDLPTVTDDTDPNPTISCEPVSGSFFPIGITVVICTAQDAAGNISTASFPVTVEPPIVICSPFTIDQMIASGLFNVIDNRDETLGDVLTGTIFKDLILASDAGNVISGRAGADCIIGGAGNDVINGGIGSDEIFGLDGSDWLVGGFGSDAINGGSGNDVIAGGFGNDVMDGESGNDTIRGQQGSDSVTGGAGDDIINGGIGEDTCVSDAGDTTPATSCDL